MKPAMPTVFIVDDEPAVLKSLSRLMRSAKLVALTFSSPQEFLDQYDPEMPGCLILDVAMPGMGGLQLQQALIMKGSEIPIIFLTGHGEMPMSVRAMKRGAVDFLTKPVNDEDLLKAIRVAIETDRVNRQACAELNDIRQRLATLTPSEREVLEHVIAGQSNRQIADDLGIAEKTIKVHRDRVMEKMGVTSVAKLVQQLSRINAIPVPGST